MKTDCELLINKIFNYSFFITALFFCGCFQANNNIEYNLNGNGELTVETHYEDGSLENIYSFLIQNSDTIAHGTFTAFYENGKKRLEREYKFDRLEGIERGYYTSGNLEFMGLYWKNKKVSSRYYFRDLEYPEDRQNLLDTTFVNGVPYYKPRQIVNPGTLLEGYEFYMHDGEKIFQQNYSKTGTKEFEKGTYAPSAIIISNSGLNYYIGDTLKVAFLVNNPPGYESYHFYKVEETSENWHEIEPRLPYNLMFFSLEEPGEFKLRSTSLMHSISDESIKSDTTEITFIVKALEPS